MERERRRAPDDLGGLLGFLHVGEFDDDPPLAAAVQGRLGDPERVDAAPQHLERAVGGLRVGDDGGGIVGFEHELGATAEIEPEPW